MYLTHHPFTHKTARVLLRLGQAAAMLAGLHRLARPAPAAVNATITVNTTSDELNNDSDCSLSEAIRSANLNQAVDGCAEGNGADTIELPAGGYVFSLAGSDNSAGGGLSNSGEAHLYNVTISHKTGGSGGALGNGGGINNPAGTLTLRNTHVAGNFDLSTSQVAPDCNGTLTSEGYNLMKAPPAASSAAISPETSPGKTRCLESVKKP